MIPKRNTALNFSGDRWVAEKAMIGAAKARPVSAAAGMAYRADFLLEGVMAVAWMAMALLPLFVLYDQRSEVGGWDQPSAMIVMAYFLAVRAVL